MSASSWRRVGLLAAASALATGAFLASKLAPRRESLLRPHESLLHARHDPEVGDALEVQAAGGADEPDEPAREAEVVLPSTRPLAPGEAAVLGFRLRCGGGAAGEDDLVRVEIRARPQGRSNFPRLLRLAVPATPTFTAWTIGVVATDAVAGAPVEVCFFPLGPHAVEIGDVSLESWGKGVAPADLPAPRLTYAGREADAPWRKAAEERIERIRKADLALEVTDAGGRPVEGARVSARMTRHAFGFGATFHPAVFDRPEFEPDRDRYEAAFLRLFNRAVLANEMKWRYWDRPGTKEHVRGLLDLLSRHGIDIRGHCMIWPGAAKLPKSVVPLLDGEHNESLRRATLDHIREIGSFYRGKVRDWDVQNEPHQHRAIQRLLGPLCQVEWFNAAREADPAARLVLNENETLLGGPATETFLATARYLREHEAPLDALGEQAHFDYLPDVQVLWAGFERLASLGLPVIVTEFDAPGVDEDAQADFTRDFYTLAFSHPAVTDVLTWSVWERTALQPGKALLRADFSPKKNLKAYEDLVFRRWWTATDLVTGPDGRCALRGFKGDYELTVESQGRKVARSIHLGDSGCREMVVFP